MNLLKGNGGANNNHKDYGLQAWRTDARHTERLLQCRRRTRRTHSARSDGPLKATQSGKR